MDVTIRNYKKEDELSWLDTHASVMVDSYAWWTVIHRKPIYENETIDLVAIAQDQIVGFLTIEINSKVVPELDNCGFVWEFGVHRNYRGNNIGLQLIKQAHLILNKQFNMSKSVWYSQDQNAQRYYEKLGMTEFTRHWQFSIYPSEEHNKLFKKQGFQCTALRCTCTMNQFDVITKEMNVIMDDDALSPKICIGYEYVL